MIQQISVFLENRPGALQSMTAVLAETSDFGIARIIVDDVYKTTTLQRDADFVHSVTQVLGVALSDTPGGLDKVLRVLADAGVNVEYMYAFLGGKKGKDAYMIFRVADNAKAAAALTAKGIRQVEQEEMTDL